MATDSAADFPDTYPHRYPPTNASPHPVVSTTLATDVGAGLEVIATLYPAAVAATAAAGVVVVVVVAAMVAVTAAVQQRLHHQQRSQPARMHRKVMQKQMALKQKHKL